MTRGRLRQWLVLIIAIVTAGVLGTTSASARPVASAAPSPAKAQACIKGNLLCAEVEDYEAAFGENMSGMMSRRSSTTRTSPGRAIATSGR